MNMKRLVFLKLGGSLITDKAKPMEAKTNTIAALAEQIASALQKDPNLQLIIGNGAGSFGHYAVITNHMQNGFDTPDKKIGFARVQQSVANLNRIIIDALLEAGVAAMPFQPSSMVQGVGGSIRQFSVDVLSYAVEHNITPVMYGDIIFDTNKGFMIASTELLIGAAVEAFLKKGLAVYKVIHNGVTQGVLDAEGKVIPLITKKNFPEVQKLIYKTDGFDVTGGMMHKIEASLMLADKGVPTVIINGISEKDLLKKALLDEDVLGTYFK